ncbi:high mobility group protein 20A [Copidosoma floridanum]|uniref:high mobility group protein 20A n=1 Tax=Copidosoma floridanum TaxID=29053 RepID=UPI0006C9B805|nr:high mobility group protein 20A [Copidosoma floridanum]
MDMRIADNSSQTSHSNMNGTDLSNKKCNKETEMREETDAPKEKEPVKENSTPKKASGTNAVGKAKKRKKCPKDAKAPKQPLTGYFRFLNDRREKVRTEHPTMPFSEITKFLAAEWNVLPSNEKKQYLDAAEQDKERYNREMNDYKQTDAYRLFLEKQQSAEEKNDLKKEKNGTDTPASTAATTISVSVPTPLSKINDPKKGKTDENGTVEIPIFTEEFLEHNKACEAELRQLRKSTTDYESQNAVLQRHVESLRQAVTRLETDTSNQETANQALQRYLDNLRSQLTTSLSNTPLAGAYQGATLQNIDAYVEKLDCLVNGNMEPTLRSSLRSAVSRLDFIK